MKFSFTALFSLSAALVAVNSATVSAQAMTARKAEGAVLALPDTRLAVVQPGGAGLEIVALVGEAAGAATDLRRGDLVLALNGTAMRSHEVLSSSLEAVAVGKSVTLRVLRSGAELTVTYIKQARKPGDGNQMIVTMDNGAAGAGVWTTGAGPSAVKEVVIAGTHIAENREGMPEVQFKGIHPDADRIALKTGDVITHVNGQSLAALAGLELLLNRTEVGSEISLGVIRAGKTITVSFRKPAS